MGQISKKYFSENTPVLSKEGLISMILPSIICFILGIIFGYFILLR